MPTDMFCIARKNMIDSQILPAKVTDEHVVEAMNTVPREVFVPKILQGVAYTDEDLALGKGQYLMEPVILARLLQAAKIKSDDIVLDIACGTGYSIAVLSYLAATVIGIEQEADLAEQADKLLQDMDICNVAIINDNVRDGYKQQAPFDVILINGAVPHIPGHITDQLANGGRLVTVISEKSRTGRAVLLTKENSTISTTYLFDAATPLVKGFEERDFFSF